MASSVNPSLTLLSLYSPNMPRIIVGLLAAVGVTMSALIAYTHGSLAWVIIASASAATGVAAYAAAPDQKKFFLLLRISILGSCAAVATEAIVSADSIKKIS